VITRADGSRTELEVTLRIDTPIEVDYYRTAASCRTCCASCWRRDGNPPDLLVPGGGIGGLSAALACARAGAGPPV
jgi:NADPH-dependent 2,4-dienoyl-CoA reductase/sulfur reductase-like enzyme